MRNSVRRLCRRLLPALLAVSAPLRLAADAVPPGPGLPDAATPAPSDALLASLPDARTAYKVGIARLVAIGGGGPDLSVTAVTFPRLLYESLSSIDSHERSDAELVAYAQGRIDRARRDAATKLASAVDSRDRLLFTPLADEAAAKKRRDQADDAVATALALLNELRSVDPALIPADRDLPLVFWDGLESGSLVDAPDVTDPLDNVSTRAALEKLAASQDLDLLIWGTVEEVAGYLAVDLYAYQSKLGTDTALGGTIALSEEIGLDAPIVARDVAGVLLGHAFASLDVTADSGDAAISIDGTLRGFGSVSAPYLAPGLHTVHLTAPGSAASDRQVALGPGESSSIEVTLVAGAPHAVRIQTSPAGAAVYADSMWIGTTPLDHDFPSDPTVVRVVRDGYLESRFVVDSSTPAVVNRALLPDSVNWTTEIARERDAFYNALAWFAISIPVTLFLNGGYESISAAFPPAGSDALTDAEAERLARIGNIFYWSQIGGVMVNVGLAINLIISIVDYVAVGEGSHNQ